jgi:hypothetical protein
MEGAMRTLVFGLLFLGLIVGLTADRADASGAQKEWTILVYIDGDNDLEPFALKDFVEMGAVGSDDKINIIAQLDRVPGYSAAYGNWTETRRFYIKKGDDPSSTPVQAMGELNTGDKNVLKDFIVWGVRNYPAKRYMVVFWNHGGGWRNRARSFRSANRAMCWDETSNDASLLMRDVRWAMQSAQAVTSRKLDIVAYDMCLMGMIEVANDMVGVADYMVASEEVEPGDGWDYKRLLTRLQATPTMLARDLAKAAVEEYHASYSGKETAITQAAIDLAKVAAINTAVKNFVAAANQWSILKDARLATRTYSEGDGYPHADLVHFMKNIKTKGATDPTVVAAADAVIAAVQAAVVANKYGSARTNSNGLAVYFPKTTTQFNNAYGNEYKLSTHHGATGWGDFIAKFLNPPADKPIGGGTVNPGDPVGADGSGAATISRKTPIKAGSVLRSVTLTFKAAQSLSGGQVRIDIPTSWTKPTTTAGAPGEIAVKFGTGQSGSVRVSGHRIYIDCDVLGAAKSFKLYYRRGVMPTTTGEYEIKFLSKSPGGTLRALATSPKVTIVP